MEYGFKITTHGRAVLTTCAVLGIQLELTRVAVGSGKVDETMNLADVHEMVHYEDEGLIGERRKESDHLYLTIQYSNKNRTTGAFPLSEFMVFAQDPITGQETDFLYATLGDYPQGIPGCNDMIPASTWEFPLVIVVSSELEVKISALPGLVTWEELEDALRRHNIDPTAHPYLLGLCGGLDARLSLLELMYNTNVSGNPFTVTFESLTGLVCTGVWNTELNRLEF